MLLYAMVENLPSNTIPFIMTDKDELQSARTHSHVHRHHLPLDSPEDFVSGKRRSVGIKPPRNCEEGFFFQSVMSSRDKNISKVELLEGTILDTNDHPTVLREFCNSTVKSVQFILNGVPGNIESRRPFSISGYDRKRRSFFDWKDALDLVRIPSWHTIETIGYSEADAEGDVVVQDSVHFRVSSFVQNHAGFYYAERRYPTFISFSIVDLVSFETVKSLYPNEKVSKFTLMTHGLRCVPETVTKVKSVVYRIGKEQGVVVNEKPYILPSKEWKPLFDKLLKTTENTHEITVSATLFSEPDAQGVVLDAKTIPISIEYVLKHVTQ